MAIPERFVDELVARTDIVDLVSEYVRLNKKGRNYWGLCPFHSEKTPSFSVSADKQIYKCFGCGKGGGPINFVMDVEDLPFPDAVRSLAKRAGLEVPETGADPGMRERRKKLLEINRQAARIFHRWLYQAEGEEGLKYLLGRGLSRGTLTNFGLGFAPNRWDGLITAMAELGYDKRELLDAGLAVSNQDGRIYDRFRNRVMFPIIDIRGEVIGFGGRVMDDSTPKYLNSPDTPVYNKSRNVFALNISKKSKAGRVILTEGYMDTIALHQAGFDSAVASLGTSLTAEHAQLLARYFQDAVIAYDGDSAGVSAAQRAIPLLEKTGMKVRVLRMKGAKDPDEFIKKFGHEAFSKLLDESENHVDYRLEQIRRKYALEDDGQKVEFLREATGLIASLYSAVEREIYGGHAAQMAGVSPESVAQEVQKELFQRRKRAQKKQDRQNMSPAAALQPKQKGLHYENIRSARAEEGIIRLCLLDPGLIPDMSGLSGGEFSSPVLGKIFDCIRRRYQEGLSTQLSALTGELEREEMEHLTYIASQPESAANAGRSLSDYIAVIRQEILRRKLEDPNELLRAAQRRHKEKKAYMEEKE